MARLGREKRMLAYSEAEQQDIIERATEREMMRSIIESEVDSAWTTIKETSKEIGYTVQLSRDN